MWGVVGGRAVQPICTWLPTTAATAGPAPPYGTRTMSAPVAILRSSAPRSGVVPTPGVAILNLPGLLFASATRSCIVFADVEGCTVKTFGDAAALVTGRKLLYGSYGIFA